MGFLTEFFSNVFRDGGPEHTTSSFAELDEQQLEAHMSVAQYGEFMLSDAVRPSFNLEVVPRAGFRHDVYQDKQCGTQVPVLMASVSSENVFEAFMEMIDLVGTMVDVVLETSHETGRHEHEDLYREHIDLPVLKSILWDHEDLLTNDGCTGVAVLNPNAPIEVQFDEHKLLVAYGEKLDGFESVLRDHGLACDETIKFITEAEHVHSSNQRFIREFDQLKTRLGIDMDYE